MLCTGIFFLVVLAKTLFRLHEVLLLRLNRLGSRGLGVKHAFICPSLWSGHQAKCFVSILMVGLSKKLEGIVI